MGVLRLRDAVSGELRDVGRRRSSLVGIRVAPGAGSAEALRRALVADLIRRVVELHGGQAAVTTTGAVPNLLPYNVHPPTADLPPSTPDVVVGDAYPGSLSVAVGPVSDLDAGDARDPVALRLLLLSAHHTSPVVLRSSVLVKAAHRLAGWRELVRRTAAAPSGAIPAGYAARLLARADDDLDLRGVLDLLEEIAADASVADGARFELFLYADRLLGLDLTLGQWT